MQIDKMAPLTVSHSISDRMDHFEKKISPEKKTPSPGGAMNRRPPSPGGMNQLTPTSAQFSPRTQNSPRSASPKRRPMPGGALMVSPSSGADSSNKNLYSPSPNTDGTKRRPPSPGMMGNNSPLRQRPPSPGDLKEKPEPKRFVFSSEATGVTPSKINVSGQSKSIKWANDSNDVDNDHGEHVSNTQPLEKNNNKELSKPLSLGMKKSSNPVRDNPEFLQKMAEESDSDDEELDDGGRMNKLSEIAQLAAATEETKKKSNDKITGHKKISSDKSLKKKDNFAHPAKHWVNLRSISSANTPKKEKDMSNSDDLVQSCAKSHDHSSDASVSSADSGKSALNQKLTPSKKAVYQKFREARERQARRSNSPKPAAVTKPKETKKSVSPPRKIIKPSPIKASGPLFVPIRKRNNGDDHSISSYTTQSFDSAMYGGKKNKVSLAQRARRASSRSPMRYRAFEEGVKTNQSKDEQLSAQKGLTLILAQNKAIKQMETFDKTRKEKDDEQSKQSITRLSSNLARLKALNDERRLREEEKKKEATENKIELKGVLSQQKQKSADSNQPKVAEDEFTADCEDVTVGLGSTSQSSKLSKSQQTHGDNGKNIVGSTSKNPSQWAVIMQNRLGTSADDVSSFEDEFRYDNMDWGADSPSMSNQQPHVTSNTHHDFIYTARQSGEGNSDIIIDDISPYINRGEDYFNYEMPPPIKQVNVSVTKTNNNMMPQPVNNYLQQEIPIQPSQHEATFQLPQSSVQQLQERHIDINPYTGPFEQLLPRSTNPLIIRTQLPTYSYTLTNHQSIQPPPAVIPNQASNHFHHGQNIQNKAYNMTHGVSHMNYGDEDHLQYSDRRNIYPTHNPNSVNGFSSTQSSDNIMTTKGDGKSEYFVLSQSTESNGISEFKKTDGEDSTLIGQDHLPPEESDNSPETVSKWWESKYAESQNEEVNKIVKQALDRIDEKVSSMSSPTQKIENGLDDSDDDIFSGIESPLNQPPAKKKTNNKSDKELNTILSGDEDNHSTSITKQISDDSKHKEQGALDASTNANEETTRSPTNKVKTSFDESQNQLLTTSNDSVTNSNSKKTKQTKKVYKESAKENVPITNGRISARTAKSGKMFPCGKIETDSLSDSSNSSSVSTIEISKGSDSSENSEKYYSQGYDRRLHLSDTVSLVSLCNSKCS
jgi:hypothetical protein